MSEFGFIQTPYRVVKNGKVTDEIIYLDAAEEAQYTIAQASEPVDDKTGKFLHDQVLAARARARRSPPRRRRSSTWTSRRLRSSRSGPR